MCGQLVPTLIIIMVCEAGGAGYLFLAKEVLIS